MKTRDMAWLALAAASQSPRSEYITKNINVHEHRAPTDESIRLAKEYEEKAWNNVTNRLLVDIPAINAQVVICERSCESREKRLLFKVNGHKVDVRLDDHSQASNHTIWKEVADAIAEQILKQLLRTKP